jgi:S1-C subfamily serine protease
MRQASASVAVLFLAAAAAFAQEPDAEKVHVRMHKRIAPSVVYVQAGGQSGSGVCIDKDGYILTSPTACGSSSDTVTVIAAGSKTYQGKVVGRNNDKELVIVKIDATLPAVEFADSDKAKVGQVTYVFGDCYGSIVQDDQVAISVGVVSSIYEIKKKQRGSFYTGQVIETSAAVNPNQDGGPLINAEGKLLGVVTLNYDESKFTGIAVPANVIKAEALQIVGQHKKPIAAKTDPVKSAGWLGAMVEELDDVAGLKVKRVTKGSPAEKAGLVAGDVITKVGTKKVLTSKGFNDAMSKFEAGATVKLKVERDGKEQDVTVTLGKRTEY